MGETMIVDYEMLSFFHEMEGALVRVGDWSAKHGLVRVKRNLFLNAFYDFGSEPVLVASTEVSCNT